MLELNTPAPQGSTEPESSPVTVTIAEPLTKPQAETPAGEPQAETPAGDTEQAATGEDPLQDQKTWKEKRQERNRQRWQEYKQAKEILPARLAQLEQQVARLKQSAPPDFSQIQDINEELAERTAWKVRQATAADVEAQLQNERQIASQEHMAKMAAAWQEAKEEAKARIPDFDKFVTNDTPIHARAAPYIVEAENAADIVYHLGKNPDVARSLYDKFDTAPAKALIELGRLEAMLKAPKPKTVSTAPRPAATLSGGANPLGFNPKSASVSDMAAQLKKAGVIR